MNKPTGLQRIINATKYSLKGFKSAIKYEVAFRQELIVLILAYVTVMLIDFSIYERILLLGLNCSIVPLNAWLIVLVVKGMNCQGGQKIMVLQRFSFPCY